MTDSHIIAMNTYLADLAVFNVKIHNVHWNSVGSQFIPIHKYTEGLYNTVFEMYDQIAERERAHGHFPLGNIKRYLEITGIQELPVEDKALSVSFGMDVLLSDLLYLKKVAVNLKEAADTGKDYGTSALLDDHITKYEESIWFIKSSLEK
jgi:starvation-inducible DNA-binding protein